MGNINVLKVEPGQTPEMITMPNTLEAFQVAVGGYIEVLGLDANAVNKIYEKYVPVRTREYIESMAAPARQSRASQPAPREDGT